MSALAEAPRRLWMTGNGGQSPCRLASYWLPEVNNCGWLHDFAFCPAELVRWPLATSIVG